VSATDRTAAIAESAPPAEPAPAVATGASPAVTWFALSII
jgi:hypothetical protein